jgi:hypothetical protein
VATFVDFFLLRQSLPAVQRPDIFASMVKWIAPVKIKPQFCHVWMLVSFALNARLEL